MVITPFREIERTYFSPENVAKSLLAYEEQQKHHQALSDTIVSTVQDGITKASIPNKDIFRNRLRDAFRERLLLEITRAEVNIDDNDAFVEFIIKNDKLVPSLQLNFYALMYLLRSARTKKVTINDWFDILHFNAAPYVDYFSGDREACARLQSVSTAAGIKIKARINPNICLLLA